MAAALAGLLKIYPVLHINKSTEGRIDVLNKVRTEKEPMPMRLIKSWMILIFNTRIFILFILIFRG